MSATAIASARVRSVLEIRKDFPALERRHNGDAVAYLDGPGGTQVPRIVVDRMTEYLYRHNANTHWRYPTSWETDVMIREARVSLASFLNGAPEEIAFGANMTTLTFHVARALGRGWDETNEVVITELDHHANVAPWRALERERGVQVRLVRMNPEDGSLDFEDLERQISPRTRLVAIGAASNALGTIVDVARVASLARAYGALVFVDAVHYSPHMLVDVKQLDADFLACSAYKFYGPHIGVLWCRREILERLDVPRLDPAPDDAPERLETGTQNHEGIVGAGVAVDWLASLSREAGSGKREALAITFAELHARSSSLFERLWNGLGEMKHVRLFGLKPRQPRTPTLAFKVDGMTSDEVAVALAERALFLSHGDFYAATVIERLGVGPDGVVRVGCSAYTDENEIDRVIEAVAEIKRRSR
jgi:cysteine desulfurase family protein (TIGR01976 family)